MRQISTLFLLFLTTCATTLSAQIGGGPPPPECSPNQPFFSGASFCAQACVNCNLDGVQDQTNVLLPVQFQLTFDCFFSGGPGAGTPITLESPRWYAFIPSSDYIEFSIKNLGCESGTDLEAAIVPACGPPFVALTCSQFTGSGSVGFAVTVGQPYYLVVDGLNGADCRYIIDVFVGSASPPQLGDIGTIQGPTEVCPKGTVSYSIAPVTYATSYTWTAPTGSKINGGGNIINLPASSGLSVNVKFGSVGGQVCVSAVTACDTPKTTCITVINTPLAITQLPDITLCFESLPFVWEELPNSPVLSPGTYNLTSTPYQSYLGCDSIIKQKIIALPRKFKNLPTKYLCQGTCFNVGGFDYCETGFYQEIIPAENGCDSTLNFSLIVVPVKAVIKKPIDTLTCKKTSVVLDSEGSITGPTPFYKWLNPAGQIISTADTAVVTMPGEYSLIVTNFGGGMACNDTAKVTVIANVTPPIANAGPPKVINCEQPTTQLQGSGSVGNQYTYLWTASNGGNIVSGATTLSPTVNAPGTYTLKVTNQINGCTATSNTTVTALTLPPALSATGGAYTCKQLTVTLQAITNATNPTFAWTGPNGFTSNIQNPVVSVAGDYTVVITDGSTGCTNTDVATVTADINPPGASATGGVINCVNLTVTLIGSSLDSNAVFAWMGPNGFTSNLPNPAVNTSGAYSLLVTGENGCTSTALTNVTLDNTPPGATLAVSGNLNCNNSTVNITATSSAPAAFLTHTWTLPNGSTVSTGASPLLEAGTPGNYSVLVTNMENGCTSTANTTVVQSPAVTATISSVTDVTCNGLQNGSATAAGGGGNGTFFYQWSNGGNAATINNLGNGSYTVTVTDGEQCTATATATVFQPTILEVNTASTPQQSNGSSDGTATANSSGGTSPYSYNWSTGGMTQTITGLLPGVYSVTATDSKGCTAVSIATVNAYNCAIEASVSTLDATCFGANDGQAVVITTAGVSPFTYLWSNGANTVSVNNLAPDNYTVTVTDAANCPKVLAFSINQPNELNANATSVNMTGPATNDGSATAAPTGGTPPYTYLWSTGETTASIDSLVVGNYTVIVTDANGCTDEQTVQVLEGNCGLTSSFITSSPVCNGESNGSATIVIAGGNSPFTYLWSSGGTEETEPNLAAGAYTVTVIDVNGCTVLASVTITDPPLLTLALDNVVNTECPNDPEGSATVTANGGTGSVSTTWSNGQTGPTATGLVAGIYTATATDVNGCTTQLPVTVEAVDIIPPSITGDNLIAPLGITGIVTLNAQTLGLLVEDNCAVSSVTFQPPSFNCSQLGPHLVSVTATDAAGNSTTDFRTIIVIDNLPPTLECPDNIFRCFGESNLVQYPAPVATDNCLGIGGMFSMPSGLPSGSTFPPGATTNTFIYTDANGNAGSCSFDVNIITTPLTIALDTIIDDIDNKKIGGINVTVSGSLAPYNFVWTLNGDTIPANTEDLLNIGAGEYKLFVTDSAGCSVATEVFTVRNLVDADEPDWAAGLLIVPNPTSGRLSVIFPQQMGEEVNLVVYDLTGRRVQQQTASAPKRVEFDLSALPSGLYTMLIRLNDEVLLRKIVVSK